MDRLLAMLMNGFIRQFMNKAVNFGIDMAAGKGKPRDQMTPEELEKAKKYNEVAKQAKQVQKITRRLF